LGSRITKDPNTAIQHLRRTFHARGDLSGPATHSGTNECVGFGFCGLECESCVDSLSGDALGSSVAMVVVVVKVEGMT
jgi:hypothetical protein